MKKAVTVLTLTLFIFFDCFGQKLSLTDLLFFVIKRIGRMLINTYLQKVGLILIPKKEILINIIQ
jgi:hypothetical protein